MRASINLARAVLAIALCAFMARTDAQPYPSRTIQFVINIAPGGPTDLIARAMAGAMRPTLGNIIVDNRPGADGMIGAEFVKRSPPDGYTVLVSANAFSV